MARPMMAVAELVPKDALVLNIARASRVMRAAQRQGLVAVAPPPGARPLSAPITDA